MHDVSNCPALWLIIFQVMTKSRKTQKWAALHFAQQNIRVKRMQLQLHCPNYDAGRIWYWHRHRIAFQREDDFEAKVKERAPRRVKWSGVGLWPIQLLHNLKWAHLVQSRGMSNGHKRVKFEGYRWMIMTLLLLYSWVESCVILS